uniref:Polyhomeotic homolog 1 n=1 Tax=Kryptolebias marmoratus TaxID=37003 RepID=A0A3Q3GQL5_KRYMA
METDGEQSQQGASTNGSPASGASSRPSPMNSMSLYERQAVQALQALQRQPNAAQYFQQLMLQQQINSAQLQNLAAVQQVKVCVCERAHFKLCCVQDYFKEKKPLHFQFSKNRQKHSASATSTISQSVLLSGTAGGQGQMYLRVIFCILTISAYACYLCMKTFLFQEIGAMTFGFSNFDTFQII